MPDAFQFDVFLSHSAKDKVVVRAVAERLRKDGLKVWFDEWALKPGDSIPAKIEEGLEHSRVLVLCMSAHAFGSDWAQLEAGTFRFRDPLNKERRFIPLRLDNAPIKGYLAQFLYINWLLAHREQEYAKLLQSCRNPASWPVSLNETRPERQQGRYVVVLSGSVSAMHRQRAEAILNHLKTLSEDFTLTLERLEEGSVRFVLKGTHAGYACLRKLYDSGRLTRELAIEVLSVGGFEHIQPKDIRIAESFEHTEAQATQDGGDAVPQSRNTGQMTTDYSPPSRTVDFPVTLWTLVIEAGEKSVHALESLLTTYRVPLLNYLQRRNIALPDAEDFLQGFYVHLLENDSFRRASRERGRFRSFLLVALNHYIRDQYRIAAAEKRAQPSEALDTTEGEGASSPDLEFDREWAKTLIQHAFQQLETECAQMRRESLFRECRPLLHGDAGSSLQEVARRLDMSESAVRIALSRMRARFGHIIREQLMQTVSNEEDWREELRYLMQLINE